MHRIFLIAKRDYLAAIRSKAFLIGLIVAPILFGGGFIGIAIIKGQPDLRERRIAIVDHTGVAAATVIATAQERNNKELFDKLTGRQKMPRYVLENVPADAADGARQRLALSDRVRSRELYAFVEIGANALHPPKEPKDEKDIPPENRVSYYSNAGGIDETRFWIANPINEGLQRVRLAQHGIAPADFQDILRYVGVQPMSLVSRDAKSGVLQQARKKKDMEDFAVPFVMMMLLSMIVLASTSPMLGAIAEDKMQRVYEMLLGKATPFELMMGKVAGAVALSLTSSVFYVTGGLLVLQAFAMIGLAPFSLLPWFLVYLIADVMILSSLAAALGAACGSPQEAQQLAILLLSPVLLPMFLMVVVMQQPNGAFATVMSLLPPFTPVVMLMRQSMPGGLPAWQPWVGLLEVVGFTIAMTWGAARVFRIAILLQGKTPKLPELVRWAIRG